MSSFDPRNEEAACGDIPVRKLTMDDVDSVVRIDKRITNTSRREYFHAKLTEAAKDSSMLVSLGAVVDGGLGGFLMGRVYHGEFGIADSVAILDTIGVDPLRARSGIATALIDQFVTNMKGLGVESIRTQANWNEWGLLKFLESSGFKPVPRVSLELNFDDMPVI